MKISFITCHIRKIEFAIDFFTYRCIKDVSDDVHVRNRNGLPAYLIMWKCFVTLMPSISAFSAERETATATELKLSVDNAAQLLDNY